MSSLEMGLAVSGSSSPMSRIVIFSWPPSSRRPPLRMPRAVSSTAFVRRLRFVVLVAFVISHLLRQSVLHLFVEIVARRSEPRRGDVPQSRQFVVLNILAVALGEAIEKDRKTAGAINAS